jgi:hypothetical protein
MPALRCPRCGGERFVEIGPDWLECVSDVIYGGAPPELTGLPHPIHHYGPCQHQFRPSAVHAAETARREKQRRDAAAKAEAEATEETRRDESIEIL